MSPPLTAPTHFVGCDVGKTSVVVFDSRDESTRTVPNDPKSLVLTRRDLVDDRMAYQNRLAAPNAKCVRRRLERVLKCLDTQITAIEADIKALIDAHQELHRAARILRTLSGIGFVTAASVLALMPELGTLDRRKAAALAGLAPHPRQSGASDGYRRVKGGRPEVRKVLFMAALTAAKRDPAMRTFYDRLVANGKKKIVAITAVMRKLIVICNAKLRPEPVAT